MSTKLLLFSLLFSLRLSAQMDEPLRFERIEGLSQNTAYSIMKDKQGFMWIATADGLNRYDGIEMKTYKPANEKMRGHMQGRIIRSGLLEDEQEQIWFSTDLTLHCFKKKSEEFITYDLSGKKNAGTGIFANPLYLKDSHLWLASASEGLFNFNTDTKKIVHYPLTLKDAAGNYIQLMYNGLHDGKDRLWFATGKGLVSFEMNTKQWKRYFGDKAFYSISYYNDTLYVSEGKGILWLEIKNFQHGKAIFKERGTETTRGLIHRVYTDKKLNTWVGDENGNVYCKSSRSAEFVWMGNINLGGAIRTNYPVYCFFADTTGILWTGAYMLGLQKAAISRREFKVFPQPVANRVNENLFVNTIYEDENDKVWLGTFQKGIVILDKKSGKTSSIKLPYTGPQLLYGNSVHVIHSDSKGNLWTGISGYLFVRERGADSFIAIKIPSPSNALQNPQVWSFTEYIDGWLFGTTIGLYFVFKENGQYSLKYLSRFGQGRIPAIWKNGNKEVWVAFESGGLTIAKDSGGFKEVKRLFLETNVKAFLPDERHQLLWISTSDGLIAFHLPSGRYKNFADKDGLLNSYVYGVLQDSDKLWISTNYGLFRAEISFKKDSVLPDVTFTNFTSKDGLPDNQFNNLAFYKGQSGNLYFGTTKGLVWFNPAAIKSDLEATKLRMINLLVNEKRADSATAPEYITQLSLPYYKNNLFFRFRGIGYSNPTKINYAYKLEGWDKDWLYSGTLNEVRYNNLPHGSYIFNVKAANGSGVWNEEAYTVSVTIYPPFWRTWWFYSLVAGIILGLVIAFTKKIAQRKLKKQLVELEKQRELDQERQRIAREMHDDIGAGLTQITLMSESAKNKIANAGSKELEDIADTSRQLVSNMSEIIWSLNAENKTLEQLCAYLREQLNKQLEYSGMEYHIHLPENGKEIILSNEQRRNILLVTKEIVNNAIKYSAAKNISIKVFFENKLFHCFIDDNGEGFDTTRLHNGNGLKNIEQRVKELNGWFEIDAAPGKGSRFAYYIPIL